MDASASNEGKVIDNPYKNWAKKYGILCRFS